VKLSRGGRLDLKSLTPHAPCTIVTGVKTVKLMHDGGSIELEMYLKGVGSGPLFDTRNWSIKDESGKGFLTYWFHLDRLAPRRLYEVVVTGFRGDGSPDWLLSDNTPDREPEPEDLRPGRKNWSLLDRLFGKDER
jgi:hypothetical protein